MTEKKSDSDFLTRALLFTYKMCMLFEGHHHKGFPINFTKFLRTAFLPCTFKKFAFAVKKTSFSKQKIRR